MSSPRKVFLSYRSIDRKRVRVVAEALLAAGIDAWWGGPITCVILFTSLRRVGGVNQLQRALDILLRLQKENRLNKTDEWMVSDLREQVQAAKSAGAEG